MITTINEISITASSLNIGYKGSLVRQINYHH